MNLRRAIAEVNPYKLLLGGEEVFIQYLFKLYGGNEASIMYDTKVVRDVDDNTETIEHSVSPSKIGIKHLNSDNWFYLDVLYF